VNIESFIHQEADKCVKCGLCLPHCPTYLKTRNEADSPRGRIALLQGLVENALELSPQLSGHIDGCLSCRACEHACPSVVRFGQLMDAGRALIKEREGRSADHSRQARLTARLRGKGLPIPLLRLYQKSGMQWLARRSGILKRLGLERLDRYLPLLPRPAPWREVYGPVGDMRGSVALFTGCMGPFEQTSLEATASLLVQCGYRVHVPRAQVCCGALDQHEGNLDTARAMARSNINAFNALSIDAVIFTASGCGATLSEYQALAGQSFQTPVMDSTSFLQQMAWPSHITFTPLARRVAVHDPCTLTHVLRTQNSVYSLLALIPEIQLIPLPGNTFCCGAAGSTMISQPEMADTLLEDKIAALDALQPDILVTSNIGCGLHLAAGIREAGLAVEVMHPVALLERQVKGKDTRGKIQGK